MTKKMLIDATHVEETRVAVVDNGQLEEFDYESMVRKQIKGGIYLAKVTRVEPSLQAAFVNYGGNRHGFLPFSEIHPDYFRIPVSDREALLEEQKAEFDRRNNFEEDEEAVSDDDNEDEIVDAKEEGDDESDSDDEEAVVEVGGADKPADEDDSDLKEKAKKKSKKASQKASKKASKKKAKKSAKKSDDDEAENSDQDVDKEIDL